MISQGSEKLRLRLRLKYSGWDAGTAAVMAGQLDDRRRQCWDAGTAAAEENGSTAVGCRARKGRGRMRSGLLANPSPA